MRTSRFFLSTSKEAPAEAELVSHKLMLRAGLIKRLGSGLYTWMPLGLRILRKVEAVVRAEMNRAGAIELLMPAVIPAELWQESGRWDAFGPLMLKIKDRHQRDFLFGPTHEEVITDLARRELKSYKQLPVNFYQIQTKFRDEIRPRFGVMRAREFLMKDAYSFHPDEASLDETYQAMHAAYTAIFSRLGLKFRAVEADTGAIGGSDSHEFHVLADSGEDAIAFCPASNYAANVERAELKEPPETRPAAIQPMDKVNTPGKKSIEEVSEFLKVPPNKTLKALAVMREAKDISSVGQFVLLLLRGDHELNEVKLGKIIGNFRFATDDEIERHMNCRPGYIGPVIPPGQFSTDTLPTGETSIVFGQRIIADLSVKAMSDFVCGANEPGFHLTGVNFGRDLPEPEYADIRNVVEGDPSPDGSGTLELCRGIEVGHIFKLGTKYSEALNATVLDEAGQARTLIMGCYGIGVSRIVAAAIEQGNDPRGIVFPQAIAPFELAIVPLGYQRDQKVRETADRLYDQLTAAGIDVLLDDRDERPGVKFADIELIGVAHRLVVSERGLGDGRLEYRARTDAEATTVALAEAAAYAEERVKTCRT